MKNFLAKNKEVLGTIISILSAGVVATWFITSQIHSIVNEIHSVRHELHAVRSELKTDMNSLDKRLTVIETILIMQGAPLKAIVKQEEAPQSH